MYRIVFGSVVVVSLMAGGSALAIEAATSAGSHSTQAAPSRNDGTAKAVRHGRKSGTHNKVARAYGVNAKPRTAEPFGAASGVDLPVASPQRESAPSETPWTGFHVGVEGGRSSR